MLKKIKATRIFFSSSQKTAMKFYSSSADTPAANCELFADFFDKDEITISEVEMVFSEQNLNKDMDDDGIPPMD
jgi:hypothetical protein